MARSCDPDATLRETVQLRMHRYQRSEIATRCSNCFNILRRFSTRFPNHYHLRSMMRLDLCCAQTMKLCRALVRYGDKMQKQLMLFGLVWVTCVSGPALADGMPGGSLKDATPTWSGFYAGIGGGYGHMVSENNYFESPPAFSSSLKGEGAAGGFGTLTIGYDRMIRDRMVAGLFVDYDFSNIELSYQDTNTPVQKFTLTESFSIGARTGFLLTPTSLLFVSGGYTWAHGKSDQYFDIFNVATSTNFPGKSSLDLQGWFAAVGMETMISSHLALRGEVRYTRFNDELTNSGTLLGTNFEDHFHAELLAARMVLTYKFDHPRVSEQPLK
jgi:opacity protein-like surface antigen